MKIGPQDILLTLCIYRRFAVGSSRAVWAVPQSHSHSAVVFWCGSTVSLSSAHEDNVPNMTRILHSRYRFGCVDTGESGKRRVNPVQRREGAAKFASVRSDIQYYVLGREAKSSQGGCRRLVIVIYPVPTRLQGFDRSFSHLAAYFRP
jgi:hypothetical protein